MEETKRWRKREREREMERETERDRERERWIENERERETTPVHHFVNVCHKGNRHSAADDIVDIGRGEDPVDSRAKYTEP